MYRGEPLKRLKVFLKPLARDGAIDLWDDTRIQAGDEWREEIKRTIEKSKVAILLVSGDFLASDFIYSDELPPLLESAKKRGLRIMSVIVGHSSYKDTSLARYQAINSPSKPLNTLSEGQQDEIFVRVYEAVRDAFKPRTGA